MDPNENEQDNQDNEMDDAEQQQNEIDYRPDAELADLVIVERDVRMEEDDDSHDTWEESESSEDDEDKEASESSRPYEISRSSRHEYLGDTEEVFGRTLVEDNDCITIPILIPSSSQNLVLLPSQTLPLTVFCPTQQSMLRNVISRKKIIGIIHTRVDRFDHFGTTAEIYEYHASDESPSLSIKAKGRQRFKVINTYRETTGINIARVKILPEIRMPNPLFHTSLLGQLKKSVVGQQVESVGQRLQFREVASVRSKTSWNARRRAALLTPWPSWVYDMYDDQQLSVRLVNKIVTQFNLLEDKLQIPSDPQELSHWAAVNLPLKDAHRLVLLSLNTATQRLRFILSITSQNARGLFCTHCHRCIANTSNIFCMSSEGPQGTFVNPDGFIHEMITVTKVSHVNLLGKASSKHSWFPGYAWKIAVCSSCHKHVGWLFTAEKNLKPRSFYGITRSSVESKMTEDASHLKYVI